MRSLPIIHNLLSWVNLFITFYPSINVYTKFRPIVNFANTRKQKFVPGQGIAYVNVLTQCQRWVSKGWFLLNYY